MITERRSRATASCCYGARSRATRSMNSTPRCVRFASAARRGVDWSDQDGVTQVAEDLAKRRAIRFQALGDGNQKVLVDAEDVSVQIRDQAMGQGASRVSAIPGVRAALLDMQRVQASEGGVVLEGRDIGTVVFPDAEAKFFLTASPQVRAERRYQELIQFVAV